MKKLIFLLFTLASFFARGQSADGMFHTVTASGTNTYTIPDPLPAGYDPKEKFVVTFTNGNTGAATLTRNSLGAKAIVKNGSSALVSGDIAAGQRLILSYDGTNFQIVGGAGAGGTWGGISGTLTNQVDLNSALQSTNNIRTIVTLVHDGVNQSKSMNTITKLSDGRYFCTLQLSSDPGETAAGTVWGMYSSDRGNTWGAPFLCIPIASNEIYNTSCAIFPDPVTPTKLTMVYLKYYHDGLQAGLYKATSTNSGASWTVNGLLYGAEGDQHYLDPAVDHSLIMNDGTWLFPFSQWITVGEGGPNDRGSQIGWYKGLILKSTDQGATWTLVATSITDPTNHFVSQTGLFQFEDTRVGVPGTITFYARCRGGYVGMWTASASDLTTWTFQTPLLATPLVAPCEPSNIKYYPSLKTIVAVIGVNIVGAPAPEERSRLEIWSSYNYGVTWSFNASIINQAGNYISATIQFSDVGNLLVCYANSNGTTQDAITYVAPISIFNGQDMVTTAKETADLTNYIAKNTAATSLQTNAVNFIDGSGSPTYTAFTNNGSITSAGNNTVWSVGTGWGANLQIKPANSSSGFIDFINNGTVDENSYRNAFRFTSVAGKHWTNVFLTNDGGFADGYSAFIFGANSGANFHNYFIDYPSNTNAGSQYVNALQLRSGNNSARLIFSSNESDAMSIYHGNIGIGGRYTTVQYTPTAYLHLAASDGRASAGSFKIDASTLLGTPEAGSLENDGTKFYFTPSSTRQTFMMQQGSATNDAAAAGSIGEYVASLVATGSAVSLTTATAANVTSISLTAGDWDVTGSVNFKETTSTVTARSAGLNTTSATLPNDGSEGNNGVQSTVTTEINSITLTRKRFSLSTTTTIYLVGSATFSAGTCGAYGALTARRMR